MQDTNDINKPLAIDVLLRLHDNKFMLATQAENQRAVMSNFLITIAAVMFAFISQQDFAPKTIVISLFTICLGAFGLFMSAKYSQHYLKNYVGATLLKKQISQLCPEAKILELEEESRKGNQRRNPFLWRFPTVYLWNTLHASICLVGILCILLSLMQ